MGHLRRADGTFTQDREEILDTLMDSFFPDSKPETDTTSPREVFATEAEFRNIFTPRRLRRAFASFKKKKAPGPDGLRP